MFQGVRLMIMLINIIKLAEGNLDVLLEYTQSIRPSHILKVLA